jgi:hypothetical protein
METNSSQNINSKKESSPTTKQNKNYIGGGTTPDSDIIVNKSKSNNIGYVIVGVVGAYVIYKMFFNKKSD